MTFDEYQKLALRTCKEMDASIYNSIHMVLGITSEYLEVLEAELKANRKTSIDDQIEATINLKKEIGDVLWYVAGLAYFNNLDFSRGYNFRKLSINKAIETINSVFKANWIYDRAMIAPDKTGIPLIDQVQEAIYNIIYWAETSYPFKIEDVMQMNIQKLQARYPEAFSENLANNRKPEDN